MENISFETLLSFEKILVYGAGLTGTAFLGLLSERGADKTKISVWDEKYKCIKKIHDVTVSNPNFIQCNDSDGTIVIIAISASVNFHIINKLEQKFIDAGYKHIALADYFIMGMRRKINTYSCADFEDNSYFDASYQDDMDFSKFTSPIKPIAFYLPQFHEIPENSEWWGRGFTEWTNTKKAVPNFKGHYQPRVPHDSIGYYDLSEVNAIRKQAELAKRHGIFGWCIYYYWFSGKKLLTKPIDLLMQNKDIDMNFCLLWCNEPWSKRWIGNDRQILVDNDYTEDDPVKFIDDLKVYMQDERYIKIAGKPIIMIYHVHTIPDVKSVVRKWRKRALEIGIGEIAVMSAMRPASLKELKLEDCIDVETEFCSCDYASEGIQLKDEEGKPISNYMYNYDSFLENYLYKIRTGDHKAYLSCVCGFDNTPRYAQRASIYNLGFSLKGFYDMTQHIVDESIAYNKEFIFIFAWNEWAESAYLEPDQRFGYALINTFSKALFKLPLN